MKRALVRSHLKSRTFLLPVGMTAELPAFADTVPACGTGTFFRRTKAVIVVTLLGVAMAFFAQEAKADAVTYTYIGGNFTTANDFSTFPPHPCIHTSTFSNCYAVIGDSITATATLDITPGVAGSGLVASSLGIGLYGGVGFFTDQRFFSDSFDVDASGNITHWNMSFRGCNATPPSHDCPIEFIFTSTGPSGSDTASWNLTPGGASGPSGVWITPEPPTLLLLGFGVAGIIGLKFRKASLAARK